MYFIGKNNMKKCRKCKKDKDLSDFYKSKRGKNGINPQCKTCFNIAKTKFEENSKENYANIKGIIKEKICSKCKELKISSEFYVDIYTKSGLKSRCKTCSKSKIKYIRKPNSIKKTKEYLKKYYQEHKDIIKERSKLSHIKNKEKNREKKKIYRINYRETRNKRDREKRQTDPMFRLNDNMSSSVGSNRIKKGKSWKTCVGYTQIELKKHLESKFTKGMTWENYGKYGWHIDHVIPKSHFNFDSYDHPEFKKCWALSNLQPLWATTEIAILHGEDDSYLGNLNKGKIITY